MRGRQISLAVLGLALSWVTAAAADSVRMGEPAAVAAKTGGGFQDKAAVACGADTYLAVWQEGAESADFDGRGTDIYCARIAADGTCLDPKGIAVCKAKDNQLRPRVAFGGGVFLVAWEDWRGGTDCDIYASRVAPDGKVLDPEGFPLAAARNRNQVYATVASNGKDFLVAWMDYWTYPVYGIAATRVGADGKVGQQDGTLIVKAADAQLQAAADKARAAKTLSMPWCKGFLGAGDAATAEFPWLVWSKDRYLLYFRDAVSIMPMNGASVCPVSAAGEITVGAKLAGWRVDKGFDCAFVPGPDRGWLYCAGINLERGQEGCQYQWVVTAPDGTVPPVTDKGEGPTVTSTARFPDGRRIVDLNTAGAFDGSRYWLVTECAQGIAGGRVSADGKHIDDLNFATPKGKPLSALMIAEGPEPRTHPALASDGKGTVLAVWTENAGVGKCLIKCRTVKQAGQ